jgi:hypothetical protein
MAMHPYQDKGLPVSGGMRPRMYHPHSWPGTSEDRVRFAATPSYGGRSAQLQLGLGRRRLRTHRSPEAASVHAGWMLGPCS